MAEKFIGGGGMPGCIGGGGTMPGKPGGGMKPGGNVMGGMPGGSFEKPGGIIPMDMACWNMAACIEFDGKPIGWGGR